MTMIIDSPKRREHLAAIAARMPAHVERLSWSAEQIRAERGLRTPEQFVMKSERQFERIALCWSGVGSCGTAKCAVPSDRRSAARHRPRSARGGIATPASRVLRSLDLFQALVGAAPAPCNIKLVELRTERLKRNGPADPRAEPSRAQGRQGGGPHHPAPADALKSWRLRGLDRSSPA